MRNAFAIILIASLMPFASYGQSKLGKVTGMVNTTTEKGIEGATVTLLTAKDNKLVKSAITDRGGAFELEKLADGNYILNITAIGYASYVGKPFSIDQAHQNFNAGGLQMITAEKDLGTVKVSTVRPLIENKIDKLVLNVEASITNAGSNALEVLEKSPGVTVDRDGNISLKGKQGVIVLIDGKQTYLSASDLATLLRNTPANQLDQVEIMSQPSAKFDAAGNSGMINIKTKKNQQQGYNGNLSLSYIQGIYPKSNNSFVFNKRKGKLNAFATVGASYNRNFFDIELLRNIRDKSTNRIASTFDQETFNFRQDYSTSIRGGVDFFATKKTTIGVTGGFTYLDAKGSGESSTDIFNGAKHLTHVNIGRSDFTYDWHNYSANLNFRHVIDTTGKELTADIDYLLYNKTNTGTNDNFTYNANNSLSGFPLLLRISAPSDIKIYTAKADYVHPIKKVVKFEAGVKSSYVRTDNIADYTYYDHPSDKWKVDHRTNHFKYNENINAAYINASRQIKKWGYQLGLRLENTLAEGKQIVNNKSFRNNYTQLFPTSYVSYTANNKNTFALSFGRRIDRPNYQDMNPFVYFLDKYSYREGNPALTPQFTRNLEVSHNYKGQLNTSINYTRTTDVITDIFTQSDADSSIAYQKRNIATRRNIGLSINYNKAITKVWNFTFFTNIFNNYFNGVINNAPLAVDYTTFSCNTSSQFRFKKGWSAEISGLYRHKNLEASSVSQPIGMLSFGAAKQILKNKGTLRLNVRDVLYTMKFRSLTQFDNLDMRTKYTPDNRQVALAFNYRFGKNQNNIPTRKRTNASQEEQNRTGQDSGN